jgi:hypothetical protein
MDVGDSSRESRKSGKRGAHHSLSTSAGGFEFVELYLHSSICFSYAVHV